MKNILLKSYLVAILLMASLNAHSQDTNTDFHTITIGVPEVAIVDIEPMASKNIVLGFTAPLEAGLPIIADAANNSLWLNYSSIKSETDATRTVSVRLSAVVPGIDIQLTAAGATGSGGGSLGTPSAQLTLTAADQTVISGIGSAYTGDGVSNGHNLSYVIAPSASEGGYADLEAAAATVATVTYTISDN
ncbi:hypothetical protein [Sphingobacterium sp.]|uniref:hypothetical protein n=1 Tax=Sphingobacterium sp. TaxID=341027 RepID=UPI0028B1D0A3|nr:hypothetical protein [Sphingobacterium sp.]